MGYGPSHYSIIVLCRLLGLMYCSEREKGEGGTRIPNGFSQPMTIVSLFHLLSYPLFSYPQREHIPLVPSYDDKKHVPLLLVQSPLAFARRGAGGEATAMDDNNFVISATDREEKSCCTTRFLTPPGIRNVLCITSTVLYRLIQRNILPLVFNYSKHLPYQFIGYGN